MLTPYNNKIIQCCVCGAMIDKTGYNEHITSTLHVSAMELSFKDRIDFEDNKIFPTSAFTSTSNFFNATKNDFLILFHHIVLKHTAVLISINYFALFHETSSEEENIVELKHFTVQNKVILIFTINIISTNIQLFLYFRN